MNLSLLEDAQVDAIEAIESFNQLAHTLGDQFEDELFSCFNRIKRDPKHFAENEGGFRSARLKRFRAVVSFKIHQNRIYVARVLVNGRENPSHGG